MKQNVYIAALLAGMLALAGCGGGGSGLGPDAVAEKEAAAAATAKAEAEAAAKAEAEAAAKAAEEAQAKAIAEALAKAEADRKAAADAEAAKKAEMEALNDAVMALNKALMAAEDAEDGVTETQITAVEDAHAALDAAIKGLETDADSTAAQAAYDGAVADLMAVKETKAEADRQAAAPKSVAAAGISATALPAGESQTIEVKAGTPRDFGTKRYTCPEGTCSITFTNELGTIVAMATGGVTVADVPPLPPGPPTIDDPGATIAGTSGTADSGPVMIVREKRDWDNVPDTVDTEGWGIVVKSGTKEAVALIDATSISAGWSIHTDTGITNQPIGFSVATNAQTDNTNLPGTTNTANNRLADVPYMTLGAWVIYPSPTLASTGKVAYASQPLGEDGMTLLASYKNTEVPAAKYYGAAAVITVTAEDTDTATAGVQAPKYIYTPVTGAASTLIANFKTMKINGFIDLAGGTAGTEVLPNNADIKLTAIDIGSNYQASGNITTTMDVGRGLPPKSIGTWNAEFVQKGRGVVGGFDQTTGSATKLTDPSDSSNASTTFMRHYGAFGATSNN